MRYILESSFDEDIKASFCKLVLNIYINKEPRTIQTKPNLVRVININEEQREHRTKTGLINLQNLSNNLKRIKWRSSTTSKASPEQKSMFDEEGKENGLRSRGRSDYQKMGSSPLIIREKKKLEDQEEDQGKLI